MARGRPPTPPGTYGEISVRQISTNPVRFQASLWLRLPTGKRVRIRTNASTAAAAKRRARERAAATIDSHETDTLKPSSTITQLLEEWITQHDGAPRTIEVYESTIRLHITPAIGELRIFEATTPLLDSFIRSIDSAPTGKRVRAILSGAFGLATRYGLIPHNPVRDTATVKVATTTPRALTPEEIVTFRRMMNHYANGRRAHALPNVTDFLIGTGVRISEALRIKWEDIDLDATPPTATIHVTKDGGSRRVIQLPNIALEAIKRQQPTQAISEYVFPTSRAKPLTKSNIERWIRAAKQAWSQREESERLESDVDVDWVTPHSFRRTVATLLADRVSLLAASQQLGHSDSVITEHHYVQSPNMGPPVADVLNSVFEGKSVHKVSK